MPGERRTTALARVRRVAGEDMLAEYGKDALVDARDTTSRRAAWLQFVGGSSVVAYVSTYSSHYTLASLRALRPDGVLRPLRLPAPPSA